MMTLFEALIFPDHFLRVKFLFQYLNCLFHSSHSSLPSLSFFFPPRYYLAPFCFQKPPLPLQLPFCITGLADDVCPCYLSTSASSPLLSFSTLALPPLSTSSNPMQYPSTKCTFSIHKMQAEDFICWKSLIVSLPPWRR